jgi:hypothetical protein
MSEVGTNFYGQPVTDPALHDEPHVVNPMPAGLPPVCSCGWTPHEAFEMSDHLADMSDGSAEALEGQYTAWEILDG